ncbi:MAG: mechanosensitive ion channel [Romboutsia sp.]
MDKNITVEKIVELLTTSGFKLIVGFIIISLGFKIINKFVNNLIVFLEKRDVEVTLRKFLKSLISGALKVTLIMPVLKYWGVDLTSIAAVVASAGVAIGLALQGSLSNFAGGFIILLLRPFKVGDYIAAAGYEGAVEKIDLFYTHLATIDNKEVLIPNGTLSNGSLINYSAKDTRRVDLKFGVSYDADILHVRRVLSNIVNNHKLIINHPEPFIGIIEHGNSSVNFVVRVWCNTPDYWSIYFDLLEEVKLKFDEEEISIPYPQMDVNLKKAN